MKKILFIIVLLSFSITCAFSLPKVSYKLDTNNVLIGQHIKLSINVVVKPKTKIIWPIFQPDTGKKIELIKDLSADTIENKANSITLSKSYIVTSFDNGEFILPSSIVHIGSSLDSFKISYPALKFKTIKVDTTKPIKDIVKPWKQYITFMEILPYLLILIGITAVIYLVLYILKRYKAKPLNEKTFEPKIPAHILALQQLKALDEKKLWQNAKIKLYYIELTEIIRSYIERRFVINALEMTSGEIKNAFEQIDLNVTLKNNFFKMLDNADLAKFAKYEPLPDENYGSMKICIEFVEATIPEEFKDM